MRRWLLNIGAVVSVVLWVASTVVWVSSYRNWGLAAFKTERNELRLAWASGRLEIWLARVDRDFPLDEKSRRWDFYTNQAPPRTWAWNGPEATIRNAGGFGWFVSGADGVRFYSVYVPFWVEWLLMLVLASWAARRECMGWLERRQNRRRLAGLCAFCGYDRRATTGACPECGKEAAE